MERWKPIKHFPLYSVSDEGQIRNDHTGRLLSLHENQYGLVCVGLFEDGKQHQRSVPLLVAHAFIPHPRGPFDTPINLDGNRWNNRADNLLWRPRWFAVRYNQQFRIPYAHHIEAPIEDMKTGEVSSDSFTCAIRYGLLEKDIVQSILNRTVTWPTYQEFRVIG